MPIKSVILATFLLLAGASHAAPQDTGIQFFESKIRPLFVEKCYACHSSQAKKLKGSLYLDNREKAFKGGESGVAFIPGTPEKSKLIEAVSYRNEDLQMPPKSKLSDPEIADLTAWVKMGAPWGKDLPTTGLAKIEEFDLQKRKAAHWLWKPVTPQTPPIVKNTAWPKSDFDRFILADLEKDNLSPAVPADRRTLIRRVYFDLIGLAPTPQEADDFLNDPSPNAFEKVVDHLLASPQFGERWGRHWMDLVRFAETLGHEFDFPIASAWRYRDYIVRAFNADVPYNQLILEHVAGDLLPDPRRTPDGNNESILATGFWFFNEDVQAPVDVKQHQADIFDNRIDVFGKTFLGVTVACARCHDHKFDAISTADYYALYGYMKGTRYTQHAINDRAIAAAIEPLRPAREKLRRAIADNWLAQIDKLKTRELSVSIDAPPRPADIDLAPNSFASWLPEGPGVAPSQAGDFVPGDEKHPIAGFLAPVGFNSAALSRKLEGNLRSPDFPIDKRYLHVRVQGAGARLNIVVENFNVIRDPIYGSLKHNIKSDKPAWITVDLKMWQGRQAYLELSNLTVADPATSGSPANAWFAIDRALLSDDPRAPALPDKPISTALLHETIEQWRDGKLADAPDAPARITLLSQALQKGLLEGITPAVAEQLKEYHHLEQAIPAPVFALAAADGIAGDERIFVRGNYKITGPTVHRRLLEAACGDNQPAPSTGSGRLQLAQRIADPANPLTARVYVNRIWHHLLGRGIVASTDNFGKLGEPPTNQPLLDYLAAHFTSDDNWSTKRLIKEIVLSSVYQQSSKSSESADQADPENKLFHRANIRRLEAEAIRDHLLQVAGNLNLTQGGPSVPVHLTPFMEGRGRPGGSGPIDGAGRRSIYIETRRNFLTPMLLAFDQPLPFNSMGRRTISNVPAQALILMNDPFVLEESKLWAKRALSQKDISPEQRINQMYQSAFTRPPTPEETTAILTFANEQADQLQIPQEKRLQDPRVWTDIAQTLINTKEFIFIE